MTTAVQSIRNLVNLYCSDIHVLELDRLLEKLNNEDLDVLYDMIEESYEAGEHEGIYKLEQRCQEHYDKGYSEGYDDGFSTEEYTLHFL